ncbi:MAG: hypothetical protein GY778_13665 [bacterium]|nr:hypothetical protein [bacterium]
MTTLLLPGVVGETACLTGCSSAKWLTGQEQPAIRAHYYPLLGAGIEISTDLVGKVDVKYNPETGMLEASGDLDSKASPIYPGMSEYAAALLPLQQEVTRRHELVGQNAQRIIGSLGEAAGSVLERAVPLMIGKSAGGGAPAVAGLAPDMALLVAMVEQITADLSTYQGAMIERLGVLEKLANVTPDDPESPP